MKRLVYHDQDPDGWMSAAVLLKKYPDIKLYEISKSGDELELKSGYDEVYVVDHSLWGEDNLKKIQSQNKKLIWIDHHKSAIESFDKNYPGLRDITNAACTLTWMYCFPQSKVPLAVFHVADRDLWNFESEMTDIFANYITTIPHKDIIPTFVSLIDKPHLDEEYATGNAIQGYKLNLLEEMYETGIKRNFLEYSAMVFDGDVLRSELMNLALIKNNDIDIAIVKRSAYIKENEEYIKYSLRSRKADDIDVGKIAREHNGGGHKNAAAFITTKRL